MVLLDTGTPATSRQIYNEHADSEADLIIVGNRSKMRDLEETVYHGST